VLGIFLAAFLTLASVFSAELLNDTVHTPQQLEGLTGSPVLATVPENSRKMIGRRSRKPKQVEIEATPMAQLQS